MAVPSKSEIVCIVAILDVQGNTAITLCANSRWHAGECSRSGGVRLFPKHAYIVERTSGIAFRNESK